MNKPIEIKKEYVTPQMILYTYKGKMEESLIARDVNSSAKNIKLQRKMNQVPVLEFDVPFTEDRKINTENSFEKLILFNDWYYIIKKVELTDEETRNIHVTAYGEEEELKYCYCYCQNLIGKSPAEMFASIISSTLHPVNIGYVWLGTDVENTKFRHLITEEEASVYQNLIGMAEVFNGWIRFGHDSNGNKGVYLQTKERDNGKFVKKNIDLKSLNVTYDTSEIFTRLLPYGASDELTGEELNIMSVNPTGKSYLEDYSYYIGVLGIPDAIIKSEAKYQNIKIWRDDTIINPTDLYNIAKEELAKCCFPKLEATVKISDLSVIIDEPVEPPEIGDVLMAINKDIQFIIKFRVTGIDRDFNEPLNVDIDISNIIRYDTSFQNINHTIDLTDKIITNNPYDVDGNIIGNNGTKIDMNRIIDGDHINCLYRLNQSFSQITEQGNLISLRVDEQNKSFAELKITTDLISSHVQDISDTNHLVYSEVTQTAHNIRAIVVEDSETGSVELDKDKFVVAFNGSTNRNATIDRNIGLILGNPDTGSYSSIGYDGRISLVTSAGGKPYHCLSYTNFMEFECSNGDNDYTSVTDSLPSMFDNIPNDQISVSVSIQKFYKEGLYLPYWMGGYGTVIGTSSKTVKLYGMSAWREVLKHNDSGGTSWVKDLESPSDGSIILRYTVIA